MDGPRDENDSKQAAMIIIRNKFGCKEEKRNTERGVASGSKKEHERC